MREGNEEGGGKEAEGTGRSYLILCAHLDKNFADGRVVPSPILSSVVGFPAPALSSFGARKGRQVWAGGNIHRPQLVFRVSTLT